jgi:MFS family permease
VKKSKRNRKIASCLFEAVFEYAKKEDITRIYSLVIVAGQFSAFFAPISAILVSKLTLVPAVRILYINAFVIMTIKIVVLYHFSKETGTGIVRMRETAGKNLFQLMEGYGGVIRLIGKSSGTIFSLVIASIVGTVQMLNSTFWQVIASGKLLVPYVLLPFFPMFRSVIALIFFFTVIPRITGAIHLKRPLLYGFIAYFIGQSILVFCPAAAGARTYAVLLVSLLFDGFGMGILAMLAESLVALYVNKEERARVMAIQHMIIMLSSSPFGWIGGILSGISRELPFILSTGLLAAGFVATLIFYRDGAREIADIS